MRSPRTRRISRLTAPIVVSTVMALLAFSLSLPVAWAAPGAVLLSEAVPRQEAPPGVKDFVYLKIRNEVTYRGRDLTLASTPDGSGPIITDDAVTLNVKKKGSRKPASTLTIDYSRNCLGLQSRPPENVTNLFREREGTYVVTVELRDRCGTAYSSDPYYLVGRVALRSRVLEKQLGKGVNPGRYGDPVDTAIGNLHREETDLAFSGHVFGLTWTRSYNSGASEFGPLGLGWSTSLSASMTESDDGVVVLRAGDGQVIEFLPGTGGYERPSQFDGVLERAGDGTFTIRWHQGQFWRFDPEGRLSTKVNWDGQEVLLSYDGDLLRAATGAYGYGLTFSYDANGRLATATASDGRRAAYAYGDSGQLERVTDPVGATTTYAYDDEGRLQVVTDPEGRVLVRVIYDEGGKVISQETADGEKATFAYDDSAGTATVTDESTGSAVVFGHDPEGQLVSMTDPSGAASKREYSPAGDPIAGTTRGGTGVSQAFDANGNLTRREVGGVANHFEYDAENRLVKVTDARGQWTRFAYDGSSRAPSAITDPQGNTTRLELDTGLVKSVTDPDGVTTRFEYDDRGNKISVTDGSGATTRFEYDGAGRLVAATSPLGAVERRTYDDAGRVVEETDATGATTRFRYSSAGLLVETIDPTGASIQATYDGAGRVATNTDAIGGVTNYGYDEAGNPTMVTNPLGEVTRSTYDALGRRLTETDPTGAVIRHTYGPDGEEVATTDALGQETRNRYDARGRLVATTDATGAVTRFSYDPLDRVVAVIDPTGAQTRREYDGAGRLSAEVDPLGATTRSRWTPGGRLAEQEDAIGRITRYAYDPAGRLASVTSPGGGVTRHQYDTEGRLVTETSPAGLVSRYGYDAAGRRTSETSPSGGTTQGGYRAAEASPSGGTTARGERVSVTSPGGAVRRFVYDAAGRLTTAVDANGGETRYGYDAAGRLVILTDGRGSVSRFAYDAAGRQIERTDPLGRTSRRDHDAAGRLISTTLPTGEKIETVYDPAGRVLSRTAGGSTVRFGYDPAGRRVSMEDAGGVTRYEYDPAGRLVLVGSADGSIFATTYDAAGQAISRRYPSGRQVTYGYNADGHLIHLAETAAGVHGPAEAEGGVLPKTVSFPGVRGRSSPVVQLVQTATPPTVAADFEVDADGRLTRESFPGGGFRAYQYQAGLLLSFTETKLTDAGAATTTTQLEHDPDGRIVAQTTGRQTTRFAYDPAGQLISVIGGPGGPVSFRYDATGNRTEMVESKRTTRFAYDAASQLLRANQGDTTTSYSYDAAGRLAREAGPAGETEITYDAFGRTATQRRVNGPRTEMSAFSYNGDDLLVRVGRTAWTGNRRLAIETEQHYRWSVGDDVPEILTQTGSGGEADFLYGYHRTAVATGRVAAVFSRDVHGSTVETPATREWARAPGYDAFGRPFGGQPAPHSDPVFGYRGELTVGDLVYLRARMYDPGTGRFSTPDPLDGVPGDVVAGNPYHYAGNDPVSRDDPLGLRPRDSDFNRGFLAPPLRPPILIPARPPAPPAARGLLGRVLGGLGSLGGTVVGAVVTEIVTDIIFAEPAGDPAGDLAAGTVYQLFRQVLGQDAPTRTIDSQDDCESKAATAATRAAAYGPQGVRDLPQGTDLTRKQVGKRRTLALAVYCINSVFGTAVAVSGEPQNVQLRGTFNQAPRTLRPTFPERPFDAEIKLLDGLIQRGIATPGAIGVLYMVVDGPTQVVCVSCQSVLAQFQTYVGDRLLVVVRAKREVYVNGVLVARSP